MEELVSVVKIAVHRDCRVKQKVSQKYQYSTNSKFTIYLITINPVLQLQAVESRTYFSKAKM
jgi:hypothetical protein